MMASAAMTAHLLATKFFLPPLRASLVPRARLVAWLNAGLHRKLTLISAPAGFGKTTLIGAWAAQAADPVAWIALDERDGELTVFLTAVVAALQTVHPRIGGDLLNALSAPGAPSVEALLTLLINDLSRLPDRCVLVLDDYHALNSPAIDAALTWLIDHLPPRLHLMIATREDLPLPLPRLRARDQLAELRIADLRFTPDEAASFLSGSMQLALPPADLHALHDRTEGWVAGLQLAALAARQRADASDFIRHFTGEHRFVLDYLVAEVLARQTEPLQYFLLCTAVLERLCGPLCDAVLEDFGMSGQAALEACEAANLLLVPLDDERRWYRYHHLFGEMLRARLTRLHPDQVPILHTRASAWYAAHDLPSEALHHAFAAGDVSEAAALIERVWPHIRRTRQEATLLRWIRALPDAILRDRPVLSAVCAWTLMDAGEYAAAETHLDNAERLIATPPDARVIIDDAQFASLPASIANARAYIAQARGDLSAVVTYTRQALDLLPETDAYERGTTAALLGLAYWSRGDLAAAHDSFARGLDDLDRGGGTLIRVGGTIVLGYIRAAQGRLRDAEHTYRQSLARALAHGDPPLKGAAEMYLGLSEIALARGDLASARSLLASGTALRDTAALPGYDDLWCTVEARLHRANGDFAAAFALLDEAERHAYSSPIPNVHPIPALRARMQIAAGRLGEALAWARQQGLTADDPLNYLHEYAHLTLARVLLESARRGGGETPLADALRLLSRLLASAQADGRAGSVLEITLLTALARHQDGDRRAALALLAQTVTLAEAEGVVQIFVDEGPPMARLLEMAVAAGAPPYAATLLAACGGKSPTTPTPLIDPLSARELDVLRLLRTELTGPEIAEALGVALSTVRSHTKRIFEKLDATSRRAAVNRAEDLGLI